MGTEADGGTPCAGFSWIWVPQLGLLSPQENEDIQDMGLEGAGRAVSSLCCSGLSQFAWLQVSDSYK